MKQILCFGDSNTWGLIPKSDERYPWGVRWTSILQEKYKHKDIRIIEEGLCGRTTVFDDAFRNNRNGLKSLPEILESNYPLDAAIIMLGTNDCKSVYKPNSYKIAKGIGLCVDELLKYISAKNILVVSPIHLGDTVWKEEFDPEFDEHSVDISHKLYDEYKKVIKEKGVNIINAAQYVQPSDTDQEHFTAEGHSTLADIIYETLNDKNII